MTGLPTKTPERPLRGFASPKLECAWKPTITVDCTEFCFGTECGMSRKIASLCAVLAVMAVVPAPSTNTDPCTKQVCEDGFTKQLSDEEKKVFAACVAQKKCTAAGTTQNPLISPFR